MPPKATVKWSDADANVRLLSAIIAAHPDLRLNYAELAKAFGAPSTAQGIEFQFRRIKKNAAKLREAMEQGVDTSTVDIRVASGGGANANPPTSKKATGARAATGSGRKSAKKATPARHSDDDEELLDAAEGGPDDDFMGTPASTATKKKPTMDKVQTGRVIKTKGPVKKSASNEKVVGNYMGSQMGSAVKPPTFAKPEYGGGFDEVVDGDESDDFHDATTSEY